MRINNPIIPYDGPIQGGLKPGMTVYFKGTVHHNIARFHINLQAHCDRTMHFNPRFKPEQVVVFNTFRHRRWEREERVQKMPFTPGKSFEVLFAVTCEGYQVVVNGAPFYLFKHRIPVERVTGLQIAGDVSMETVIIGVSRSILHLSLGSELLGGSFDLGAMLQCVGKPHHLESNPDPARTDCGR
ncbi:galectin-6-like [Anguilla rostrata]|uniref:galectin-6-like n=1 Tax=Anguilla rostrata TaxID=7938 RepID=UPI0030CC5800